jgi:Lipase (class 3)
MLREIAQPANWQSAYAAVISRFGSARLRNRLRYRRRAQAGSRDAGRGTKSLETFLTAAPEGTPILITGHSLGSLAPCVADWVGNVSSLSVYTIAAPSPGNEDFASYYNALFTSQSGHSTAFRFFNSLDVVPNAWASLNTVETYYPPLVSCPSDISKIIDRAEDAVGGKYRQLGELAAGSAVELPGTIISRLLCTKGEWSSILSRMHCFCGKPPNNMPAQHTKRCCRRL